MRGFLNRFGKKTALKSIKFMRWNRAEGFFIVCWILLCSIFWAMFTVFLLYTANRLQIGDALSEIDFSILDEKSVWYSYIALGLFAGLVSFLITGNTIIAAISIGVIISLVFWTATRNMWITAFMAQNFGGMKYVPSLACGFIAALWALTDRKFVKLLSWGILLLQAIFSVVAIFVMSTAREDFFSNEKLSEYMAEMRETRQENETSSGYNVVLLSLPNTSNPFVLQADGAPSEDYEIPYGFFASNGFALYNLARTPSRDDYLKLLEDRHTLAKGRYILQTAPMDYCRLTGQELACLTYSSIGQIGLYPGQARQKSVDIIFMLLRWIGLVPHAMLTSIGQTDMFQRLAGIYSKAGSHGNLLAGFSIMGGINSGYDGNCNVIGMDASRRSERLCVYRSLQLMIERINAAGGNAALVIVFGGRNNSAAIAAVKHTGKFTDKENNENCAGGQLLSILINKPNYTCKNLQIDKELFNKQSFKSAFEKFIESRQDGSK